MDNKRFTYHATGGALFMLLLKNGFLTVVTLGIYTFWAKANTQKFMAENTEWAGERFSFHGTGKERFIGFLKALAILVVGGIVLQILGKILGMISLTLAQIIPPILLAAFFLGVFPFVIVGSRKYLTSRTGFRNLRFGFDGKGLELAKIYLKGGLLTIVTLGIYYPWFYAEKEAYIASKTRYGNANFGFQVDGKEIFFIYLKGFFLSIITFGIYSSWFLADLQNYIWNHRSFQGKKFQSDLTGGKVFLNIIVAYAIVLFTLGFGLAWAIVRISKLFLESISLETEVDFGSISAKADPTASATAEGLEALAETLEGFLTI
ncbi:YjgN family protein [Leptospira ilyithenensis]|uniref:DUF898 family protein n=1 Tax=Leptospira ilyithenensis TaxID=2484901 RepID=A0A4R9LRK7_9LEPT|nr:DUF898 family protein [Leptospira ilyithenensis]TGN11163.1 DUF898 family protein [Leptospira ilyithenensis]